LNVSFQEIEASEVEDTNTELMPLGSLQKGSIDIVGANVSICTNFHRPPGMEGLECIIRIENQDNLPFEVNLVIFYPSLSILFAEIMILNFSKCFI
jgi:hypothetical protein